MATSLGGVMVNRLMVEPQKKPAKKSADAKRLPYTPPKLRRLGSVRELTFGATGGRPDIFNTQP